MDKYFTHDFFKHISENNEEELDKLVFIVFKRAYENMIQSNLIDSRGYENCLDLMERILLKNNACYLSFMKSTLFFNISSVNGFQLQSTSVLGILLSMSSLP